MGLHFAGSHGARVALQRERQESALIDAPARDEEAALDEGEPELLEVLPEHRGGSVDLAAVRCVRDRIVGNGAYLFDQIELRLRIDVEVEPPGRRARGRARAALAGHDAIDEAIDLLLRDAVVPDETLDAALFELLVGADAVAEARLEAEDLFELEGDLPEILHRALPELVGEEREPALDLGVGVAVAEAHAQGPCEAREAEAGPLHREEQ